MPCKNPHCPGEPEFEATIQERRFYDEFGIDPQTIPFCRQCREIRRISWRNERNLFQRKCDHSGEDIWTIYHPNSPYKVFDKNIWWGDEWDGLQFGRDFDFERPFFQQFHEMMLEVPRPSLVQAKNQNSDYTNDSNNNNDCYQVFIADDNVNCHYGSFINCKDCMDSEELYRCELCYDSIYCNTSNGLVGCEYCMNCSNTFFSSNLVNCHNCIFCFGLRDRKNCIFNTEVSPDVFMTFIMQRQLFRRHSYQRGKEMFQMFLETVPQRYMYLLKTENSNGDRLINCKDCENCYGVENGVACSNISGPALDIRDCMDCWMVAYGSQKSFENQTVLRGGMNFVANFSNDCSNCLYIDNCQNCMDCFGCIGLKSKKHCIFNKQYSPEEYNKLKDKLIEHLKKNNEWGQFFPPWMSPFAYDTTVADFYFPLTEEQYKEFINVSKELWPPGPKYTDKHLWLGQGEKEGIDIVSPPDSLFEIKSNEEALNTVYTDIETGEPFRIMGRELAFYQKMKLPLPDRSFRNRYLERLHRYNPRKLNARKCQKCRTEMKSAFSEESPYIVFCEECFRNSIQ